MPGLDTLRHYEIAWLRHDLFAGLALTAVLVPVGIAYAVASGVPAICGLYATIFGLLAYAVFGPSRVLVLGPDSSLVILVLGVVLPLSAGDPQRAMILAGMMAVVSGTLCVVAGAARLGFVTELLSKPIRYGYMNGIALTVLISQLPALFGFSVEGDGILGASQAFVQAVWAGRTTGVACFSRTLFRAEEGVLECPSQKRHIRRSFVNKWWSSCTPGASPGSWPRSLAAMPTASTPGSANMVKPALGPSLAGCR